MTQQSRALSEPIRLQCPLDLAIAQPDGVTRSFPFPTLITAAVLAAAHGRCQRGAQTGGIGWAGVADSDSRC